MPSPSRRSSARRCSRRCCSSPASPPCSSPSARARARSAHWSRRGRASSRIVAGIAIIVMGLHFLGITRFAFLMREKRAPMARPVGLWGAYVMGLAFAFGWTPCIGPILAAILAVAASKRDRRQGRGAARGLFGRARHSVPARGLRHRAVRRLHRPFQAPSRDGREDDGRRCSCSPASRSSPASSSEASYYLLEWFPALGRIG